MSAAPQPKSRYEIRDRLPKQGAMGVVYRAWDLEMRRFVVIKTIGDVRNSTALDHFRKEWEILANINHANIVDIYDIGEMETEGQIKPFFVMPFLPGSTLEQLIAAQSLTIERTIEIISQVCRGLQAAHDRGVIHRDLKPSNIFVIDEVGTVKIIDFGVAHLSDHTASVGLKGTLLYMSPEQIQMRPLTPASDLFSLGVVCYEALTQRRPFQGATQEEIAFKILNHVPPMVSEVNPAVGAALSQVVHAAMAKRPPHRFPAAREFGDALQKALHNRPIERFDPKRAEPRILKARRAFESSQFDFAGDVLGDLEAEGHVHPEIRQLRRQIDQAVRERGIRQMLEGARHFVEEEEYALARQKVQQLLEAAPGHPEALEILAVIEEKWTSQQVIEWMRLGREHLENQSFPQARQAAQSILSLRPADSQALQLLTDVTRVEEQIARARREAAALFQNARDAYARGEISAALSKAERVLDYDRQTPDKGAPDLAAMHQEFYNEVHGEHESIRQAVVEVRRLLAEKDFAAAYEICDRCLARYPRDAQFRALRLDVDHKERQHVSAYIAEVERQVNAEPDLNRRVAILEKAAAEFPREEHFRKALPQVKELRDLAESIVERAQMLEERSQFAEALSQWETLRNVHPAYPELDGQIKRLTTLRDQQQREELRQRRLAYVRRLIDMASFDEAIRSAEAALADFPGDVDLLAASREAAARRQRAQETDRLLTEGDGLITRGDFDAGIARLRQAFDLDHQNDGARTVLVNALFKRATSLQNSDPFGSENLIGEVLKLDPAHRGAAELQAGLAEKRKETTIGSHLARARQLREQGDRQGARDELTTALMSFPGERRLTESLSGLEEPPPAPATPITAKPDDTTRFFEPPTQPSATMPVPPPVHYPPVWKIASVVVGIVAVATLLWQLVKPAKVVKPDPGPIAKVVKLEVRPVNASASVWLNNERVNGTVLELPVRDEEYSIEARLAGYKSVPERVKVTPETQFLTPLVLHLEPYTTRLSLETAMRASYKGTDVTGVLELGAGSHTVDLQGDGSTMSLKIDADTGMQPKVAVSGNGVSFFAVVTSLGKEAELDMSPAYGPVTLDGQPVQPVGPKMPLSALAPGEHVVTIGPRTLRFQSGEAPSITVHAIAPGNYGWLTVMVTEDGANVTVTGETQTKPQAVKDRKAVSFGNLRPGAYGIDIVKEGFEPIKDSVQIQRGVNLNKQYTLTPVKASPVLIISEGMPNTVVFVDDKQLGVIDAGGQMRPTNLPTGRRTFRLQYMTPDIYDPKTFTRDISAGDQIRLTREELTLVRIRGIQVQNDMPGSKYRYRRKGAADWTEANGPMIRVPQPGPYEVERLINGVRRGLKDMTVGDSIVATQIPLIEEQAKPVERQVQHRTLADFVPLQTKAKEGWYDVDGSLMKGKVESGIFEFQAQFPRSLVIARKSNRWSFVTADRNCIEFELRAGEFGVGNCTRDPKTFRPIASGRAQAYKVRIRIIGSNIVHELAPAGSSTFLQQESRSLSSMPVQFHFVDGSIKAFAFAGLIAP